MGHGCTNYGGFGEKGLGGIWAAPGLDRIGVKSEKLLERSNMRPRYSRTVRVWLAISRRPPSRSDKMNFR